MESEDSKQLSMMCIAVGMEILSAILREMCVYVVPWSTPFDQLYCANFIMRAVEVLYLLADTSRKSLTASF